MPQNGYNFKNLMLIFLLSFIWFRSVCLTVMYRFEINSKAGHMTYFDSISYQENYKTAQPGHK